MKESTKKKKTASSSKKEDSVHVSKQASPSGNSNIVLGLVIVVLVVQLLTLVLVGTSGGKHNSENPYGGDSDLDEIAQQVERLDTFFANNAPGYGSDSPSAPTAQGNQAAPSSPEVGEPDIENRPIIGSADAPVTIVEYSDFECPFCARFYSSTYLELKEKYIESGQVKLIYKDFPLSFHQLAEPAGVAGKCVFREVGNDAFFLFHDLVFENQPALSVANLRNWALEAGISEEAYDSCIEDPEMVAQVQADFAEGQSFGISGTPSFVINGQLLVGAQPFSAFEQIIEAELAN